MKFRPDYTFTGLIITAVCACFAARRCWTVAYAAARRCTAAYTWGHDHLGGGVMTPPQTDAPPPGGGVMTPQDQGGPRDRGRSQVP